MQAARGSKAQAASAAQSTVSGGAQAQLYIINLLSSTTPLKLEAPDAPELGGFAVFRSRRVEDGRDRFRLHLGFFDSQEQAEKFLPLVRDHYPAAWVALAPEDSMGSLDDTNVAQFKYIPNRAMPAADAHPAQVSPPAIPPTSQEPPAIASSTVTTVPAEDFLHADDVLSLLESPPRQLPGAVAATTPPQPAVKTARIPAVQSFAVQLIWSTERPDTAQIPRLAIFDAYTMYTVTMKRAGRLWYGLRLGFFNDPVSARQVSLYVRSDFSAASVVPVSERECERAGEAAKAVLHQEASVRQEQRMKAEKKTPLTLAGNFQPPPAKQQPAKATPQGPASEIAAAQADFRKALQNLDHEDSREKDKPARKPVRIATGAARRGAFTTEQLLEELNAGGLSFEGEGHEPHTDTGVRHLSVALVPRRKRLSGFFSRNSDRGSSGRN